MPSKDLKPKTAAAPADTGIEPADQAKIAKGLAEALGDTYTLLIKTHVYHWNVVGPLFVPLHELLEAHYRDLFDATDEIAERIRALGQPAPVSFAKMAALADVKEETGARSAAGMVAQLIKDHERLAKSFREIAGDADEADDLVTADLLTGRLKFHEKAIWMLKAIVAE